MGAARGDRLTLAGYLEAGGVAGALTRSAESAFAALDEAGQELARRLLVRLADTDDGGALVRRAGAARRAGPRRRAGGGRRDVIEAFVEPPAARRRRRPARGRARGAAHRVAAAGPVAGGRRRRPGRPAAPGPRGPGVGRAAAGPRTSSTGAPGWRPPWTGRAGADADAHAGRAGFLDASRCAGRPELTEARRARRPGGRGPAHGRRPAGGRRLAVGPSCSRARRHRCWPSVHSRRPSGRRYVADAEPAGRAVGDRRVARPVLLLAAQAFRLADTPDTQDGLLAALAEHRRVTQVVPFDGRPWGSLADRGRATFLESGADPVWRVGSASRRGRSRRNPEHGRGWRPLGPVADRRRLWSAGSGRQRTVAAHVAAGRVVPARRRRSCDRGAPGDGAFSPDGRLVHLVVAVPGDAVPVDAVPDTATGWSVTDVDVADGAARHRCRRPLPRRRGGHGRLLRRRRQLRRPVGHPSARHRARRAGHGRTAVAHAPARPEASSGLLALPRGAAQLWADGGVTLLDGDGAAVQQLDAHHHPVRDIAVAPDGSWAVTVGDGGAVVVWDVDPDQRSLVPARGPRPVTAATCVAVTADERRARHGVQGRDRHHLGHVRRRRLRPVHAGLDGRWFEPAGGGGARSASSSRRPARGPRRCARRGAGPERPWRPPSSTRGPGRVVDSVPVGRHACHWPSAPRWRCSPDRSLVAVTWVRAVTVLDARTHEVVTSGPLPPDTVVYCAGWTPDSSRLLLCAEGPVLASAAGGLLVVDTGTWQPQPPVDVQRPAEGMATSPEPAMALGSSLASGIRLLDARTLDVERAVPLAVDDLVGALAFSDDGRLLAAGGDQGPAARLRHATWRPVGEPAPCTTSRCSSWSGCPTAGPSSPPAGPGRSRCSTSTGGSCGPGGLPGSAVRGWGLRPTRPRAGRRARRPQRRAAPAGGTRWTPTSGCRGVRHRRARPHPRRVGALPARPASNPPAATWLRTPPSAGPPAGRSGGGGCGVRRRRGVSAAVGGAGSRLAVRRRTRGR